MANVVVQLYEEFNDPEPNRKFRKGALMSPRPALCRRSLEAAGDLAEKTPLRFVPTVPITTTAATAINAAIRPYSIAVTPEVSGIKVHKDMRLRITSSNTRL